VILLDQRRSGPVAALDRIGETIVDASVDLELVDATREKLALELGEKRPDQATAAIGGVDEHVEKARASVAPGGSGNGEADEERTVPGRRDDRVAVHRLPAHLASGERA
jgi:hypothetical protein